MVAAEIWGLRVFGRRADKLPVSESLKATGREFLAKVEVHELLGQIESGVLDPQRGALNLR